MYQTIFFFQRKFFVLFFGVCFLFLSGCTQQTNLPTARGMSYLKREPFGLSVRHIKISSSESVSHSDTLSHMLPMAFFFFVEQWAMESFAAKGHTGTAHIVIYDATIKEISFSNVNATEKETYKGSVKVGIRMEGTGRVVPEYFVILEESISIPDGTTIEDRRMLLRVLCEHLLNRLTYTVEDKLSTISH